LVVSPDPGALAWAARFGHRVRAVLQPSERPGLNGAIDAGREWAIDRDADAVFSLFADLPLISAFDIRRLIARRNSVVLGPDRRCEGTNALLLRLHGAGADFRFAFGEDSLARHLAEARRLGLNAAVQETPGIGFDLDTPLDWEDYLKVENGLDREAFWEASAAQCGVGGG